MARLRGYLLAALLITSVYGYDFGQSYSCNEATCKLPNCHCASSKSPIPLSETPQFILITNDDSVDGSVAGLMSQITNSANNTNSCPIPATWFTLSQGTDCKVVQNLWKRGDEIATHTVSHPKLKPTVSPSEMTQEIVGGRDFVVNQCGIPLTDVAGFRSTFLVTNPGIRKVVQNSNFTYDSSIEFTSQSGSNAADRPWPFTMDSGTAQSFCPKKFQPCTPSESYPGLWQVPIWDLVYQNQTFTMDPGAASEGNGAARPTYNVLKDAFDATYSGNKAPLPIYVHNFWFTPERTADTNKFIQYALQHPNTYFVTMSQLVDWMRNPVPNKQMPVWLKERCGGEAKAFAAVAGVVGLDAAELEAAAAAPLSFDDRDGFLPAILGRKMLASD